MRSMTPTQRTFFIGYVSGLVVALVMSIAAMHIH